MNFLLLLSCGDLGRKEEIREEVRRRTEKCVSNNWYKLSNKKANLKRRRRDANVSLNWLRRPSKVQWDRKPLCWENWICHGDGNGRFSTWLDFHRPRAFINNETILSRRFRKIANIVAHFFRHSLSAFPINRPANPWIFPAFVALFNESDRSVDVC